VVATVPVGDLPVDVAIRPDGDRAYVTNFGDNSVKVIDTSTNLVVATVAVGTGPTSPAVTPDGTRLYVPNGSSDDVSMVNTSTNMVVATLAVGDDPRYIAITPDGTRAYVTSANSGSSDVTVIDTDPASPNFNTVIASIATATSTRGVAITPDGAFAYVAVGVFLDPGRVDVIDTNPSSPNFHTVLTSVTVENNPWGVAITPDGTRVYVVNNGSNSVPVIRTADNTVTATLLPNAGDPQGIAITPDGTRAYLASTFDLAKVIDTDPASGSFHTVIATVGLGLGSPAGVAITPAAASDDDLDGFSPPADCDDADPDVFLGNPEFLDGKDNDCNGLIDDIASTTTPTDIPGVGPWGLAAMAGLLAVLGAWMLRRNAWRATRHGQGN
jgi:YVTN family beta-propeller protein